MTAALIAKLESASEGSVWTDADANELIDALGRDQCGPSFAAVPLALLALRGSIDAALALAERVLPGKGWEALYSGLMNWRAHTPTGLQRLPLLICAALLRASAAEGAV